MLLSSGCMSYSDCSKGLGCGVDVGGHGLQVAGGGRDGLLAVT